MNLPAILIVLALTGMLVTGMRESARVNAVMVALSVGCVCSLARLTEEFHEPLP